MDFIWPLVLATAILVSVPGPNVAYIVATSLKHGFRQGALSVLGTTTGVGLQLVFVVLGFAALLKWAASAMVWLKWLGVAYLVYLAVRTWRAPPPNERGAVPKRRPDLQSFWSGTALAVVNPKTLMFNAAFLPQFVAADSDASTMGAVAAVYLFVLFVGDLGWAAAARFAEPWLGKTRKWKNKITASVYFGSGAGLALARIDRSTMTPS